MKSFDAIIVGGGIIGLSIAYQLSRRGQRQVLLLDKARAVGAGSTGASSAVCRYRYSLDAMVTLARDGIEAYRQWQAFTELAAPRAAFHNDGVLWFTGEDRAFAPREHQRMAALGIATEVLDDEALAERFPALNRSTQAPDLRTGEVPASAGG
ncbi:MAG: FAD-dependent oxidoreductase, partial [Pseudomonadota bacterium]